LNYFSDGRLPKDAQKLEKKIIKQQYLVNNNFFDPTDYFGGLEVENLGDQIPDQRLEDMLFYLPTEMEENEGTFFLPFYLISKRITKNFSYAQYDSTVSANCKGSSTKT